MPITSSSTSSSEPAASQANWRGFAVTFVLAAAGIFLLLVAAVVAIDPYDTGRLALLRSAAIPDQGARTAGAGRARDPRFTGAIIGNSHVQLIQPEALTRATGIPFVSLIVPATVPTEQRVMLDYFLRRRGAAVRALVIGIDGYYCTPTADVVTQPFPYWLYSPSLWTYVAGLVRYPVFEAVRERLVYAFGWTKRPPARPDGYDDYEPYYPPWRADTNGALLKGRASTAILNETGRYPALDRLAASLAAAPAQALVVLVLPPVVATGLPVPGSPAARSDTACLAAVTRLAAGLPHAAIVDWRIDRPDVHDPESFIDHTHYRAVLARPLERDIAAALKRVEREAAP